MSPLFLVAGAGLIAGMMNALAGGGSFVTLPALIAAGVPFGEREHHQHRGPVSRAAHEQLGLS